uniref:Uncharacterized protein n=1 Tax=Monopterus albus TaxID=43700 RepID=A0A3Q3J0W5_MONAL
MHSGANIASQLRTGSAKLKLSDKQWKPRLGFLVCLRKHRARQSGVTPLLMAAMLTGNAIFYGKCEETNLVTVCIRFSAIRVGTLGVTSETKL